MGRPKQRCRRPAVPDLVNAAALHPGHNDLVFLHAHSIDESNQFVFNQWTIDRPRPSWHPGASLISRIFDISQTFLSSAYDDEPWGGQACTGTTAPPWHAMRGSWMQRQSHFMQKYRVPCSVQAHDNVQKPRPLVGSSSHPPCIFKVLKEKPPCQMMPDPQCCMY